MCTGSASVKDLPVSSGGSFRSQAPKQGSMLCVIFDLTMFSWLSELHLLTLIRETPSSKRP